MRHFLNKALPSGGPDSARYQGTCHPSQLAPVSSNFQRVCKGLIEFGARRSSFGRQLPIPSAASLPWWDKLPLKLWQSLAEINVPGLTKLLSCDKGQFFVQFRFKCPRWRCIWLYGRVGLIDEIICEVERKLGCSACVHKSSSPWLHQGMDVWKTRGTSGRPSQHHFCTRPFF